MVLRYNREQLVKKYQGKLYNSRNSLVTEQAANAGYRVTSTGDTQGRDESPICQGWFRCNHICHNVQQWPGWCSRGLFSPKWVCDLSLELISVCGTLCVGVCALFLMFPCAPGAWMSPGLYCQSPKCFVSLSFLPIYSLLIHFSCISIFTSWLLILYFSMPSCLFLSSFHVHLCVLLCCCTCAWAHAPLHAHCTLLLLPVLQWELWVEEGRQEEDFPFCNRTAGNRPVWVWKRFERGNTLVPWVYDAWQEVEH